MLCRIHVTILPCLKSTLQRPMSSLYHDQQEYQGSRPRNTSKKYTGHIETKLDINYPEMIIT